MASFWLQNENDRPGSSLRNQAADYLAQIYGSNSGHTEFRVAGKKVDGYFLDDRLGKQSAIFLEAKDYSAPLDRSTVASIWADYSGIIESNQPSDLLLVTRHGLTADAQAYVQNERARMRHRTIWELEDEILGLSSYMSYLGRLFAEDDLQSFYIPAQARAISYDVENRQVASATTCDLFGRVTEWLGTDEGPLAILGGYGAGKTSFTYRFLDHQCRQALTDPLARRPILIKLGMISRYNSIDGLLGALFTSNHHIRGYNFQRFMDFNNKGRFVIILDGFDEMKHAMSWVDFRNQAEELNNLVAPNSKLILLGRPSAFLSDAEHTHILRGRKIFDGSYIKIPGWPQFSEYRLEGFTNSERQSFVEKFLESNEKRESAKEKRRYDHNWVNIRIQEVNTLADADPEIFSRPVHAKILTELAADRAVNLSKFRGKVTRWSLYESFFRSLAMRECRKPARSPISEEYRLEFLRRLAFWLWVDQKGATNFYGPDLPDTLLSDLPDGDAENQDEKRREYLSGAFLERKFGGFYYFPHRSFVEFLVAQRLHLRTPRPQEHIEVGLVVREGVAEFLGDISEKGWVKQWADSLARATGPIDFTYLRFLASCMETPSRFSELFPKTSPWRTTSLILGYSGTWTSGELLKLYDLLSAADPISLALILELISPLGPLGGEHSFQGNYVTQVVAAALIKQFYALPAGEFGKIAAPNGLVSRDEQLRELVSAAIPGVTEDFGAAKVQFSWDNLTDQTKRLLSRAGMAITWSEEPKYTRSKHEQQMLHIDQITSKVPKNISERIRRRLSETKGRLK